MNDNTSPFPTGYISLYEEQRRELIDCPDDVISYQCKVESNHDELHLTWNITTPGSQPMTIQYNRNSDKLTSTQLGVGITSYLSEYNPTEGYIKSFLVINLKKKGILNRIHLKCYMTDISTNEKTTYIRKSGMMLCMMVVLRITFSMYQKLNIHF